MRSVCLLLALAACEGPFTEAPWPDDAAPEAALAVEAAAADDAPAQADRILSDGSPSTHPDGDAHFGLHPDGPPLVDAGREAATDAEAGDLQGDGCPLVTHTDGLGQSWQDCAPLGTFDLDEATAACTAGYGSALSCAPHVCGTGQPGDPAFHAVCGSVVCWAYDGPWVGMVTMPVSGGCPRAGATLGGWQ